MSNLKYCLFQEALRLISASPPFQVNGKLGRITRSQGGHTAYLFAETRRFEIYEQLNPLIKVVGNRLVFEKAVSQNLSNNTEEITVFVDLALSPAACLAINEVGQVNLPKTVHDLDPEQKREYNRCLDSLCRQTQSFEPTEEQKGIALRHALNLQS